MYSKFQFALLVIVLPLLSFTEARYQKKTKSATESLSLVTPGRHHKLHKPKHTNQRRTLNHIERAVAHKSHGKLFKGWQKGNESDKPGSRYYLVMANSNGSFVTLIFYLGQDYK